MPKRIDPKSLPSRAGTFYPPPYDEPCRARERRRLGDAAPYLTENMDVQLQLFEGNAISIEIPQRATFEIVDTEPVVKGQTASGSFKPAMLSNGVKTMVPTHIVTGTRVVVMTEDGAYVERAKD